MSNAPCDMIRCIFSAYLQFQFAEFWLRSSVPDDPLHKPAGRAYINCAVYKIIRRNTADQEAQIPSCNIVPINAIFVPGN